TTTATLRVSPRSSSRSSTTGPGSPRWPRPHAHSAVPTPRRASPTSSRSTPVGEPLDLSTPMRIHLVAVGGAAMAPMAELLVAMGHRVSGYDQADSPRLERLRSLGVRVSVGQDARHVEGAELVACSSAIPAD